MNAKLTIPQENFSSFVVTVLNEIHANQLVLVEAVKHLHAQFYQETPEQTKAYFDDLLEQARVESTARFYSKYGGSPLK